MPAALENLTHFGSHSPMLTTTENDLCTIPLFASPQRETEGREITEEMVERAAVAIDEIWSEETDRGPSFAETERSYQDHCRATARAALSAALQSVQERT
jgi:hypothetical protein